MTHQSASDGEIPLPGIWGSGSTHSLSLLLGSLCPEVVVPIKALSTVQQFKNYSACKKNKTACKKTQNKTKNNQTNKPTNKQTNKQTNKTLSKQKLKNVNMDIQWMQFPNP